MKLHILYPGDLRNIEWQYLELLLPPPMPTGRPRKYDIRSIINGIFYLVRSAYAWREYPHWATVYACYKRCRHDGLWEQTHTHIRELVRQSVGREASPIGAVPHSQTAKTTDKGGPRGANPIGYNAHNKVKRR